MEVIRNDQFLLRHVAGEAILIPVRGEAARENKLIVLNETAADIYELLETNHTPQQVVEKMLQIYDAREEEIAGDVNLALAKLLDLRVICAEPGEYPPDNFL